MRQFTPEQAARIPFATAVENRRSGKWTHAEYRAWWSADFKFRYDEAMKEYAEVFDAPTR